MDLDTWACPVCYSRLSEHAGEVACGTEGRRYRQAGGLPVLVRPEQEDLLREAEHYASAWKRTKWAVPRDVILLLPYIKCHGWKQKAKSFRELQGILGSPRERRVVDVGAGTGWMSYRLAEDGFRCFATDISSDSDVGLGGATQFDRTPHQFERAIATLDRWPFRSGSVDIAICNASLHYVADLRWAVAEAARVLRTDGVFVVMNSPVHRDPASANRAASHFRKRLRELGASGGLLENHQHFVASELEKCLQDRFLNVLRHDPRYGFWFHATRALRGAFVGMELASFPIYEARVPRRFSNSTQKNSSLSQLASASGTTTES